MNIKDFIKCLFNDDEMICYGDTVHSMSLVKPDALATGRFFCINPVNNGRKIGDLTAYRNILIEIDSMPLDEQVALINKLGLPYSTRVYSGNKSDHFIVALEQAVDKDTYKFIVDWTHNIIKKADPATKNGNRLSRFPCAMRPETGKIQELKEVRSRISEFTFNEWLNKYPESRPTPVDKPVYLNNSQSDFRSSVVKWVDWYINDYLGIPFSGGEIHVQCPICAQVGKDTNMDNMYVYGPERKHTCFASPAHNSLLTRELRSLYFSHK